MLATDSLLREAQKLERHLLTECSEATAHHALLAFHTLDQALSLETLSHDLEVDLVRRITRLWKDASLKERRLLSQLISTRHVKLSKTEAGYFLFMPHRAIPLPIGDLSNHASP
jgi:hypothetical protein